MPSTLTDLTAATTWSGTDLFYAVVGGNSRKIAAAKFLVAETSSSLAMQDSTTAQTFRVYRTFTDSSNYERLALQSGSGFMQLKAETAGTGTDNLSLLLTTAGSGQVVLGSSTTTSTNYFFSSPVNLLISATSTNTGAGGFIRWTADAFGSDFSFAKSRGSTIDSFTVLQNDDTIGSLFFHGSDGTDFALAAYIKAEVDGTPGNNDMPGRLVFLTSPDGSATPLERLRIAQDGAILIQFSQSIQAGGVTAQRLCFGSTAILGIYVGSGAPTVSAGQGSLYLRNDGNTNVTRMYVNSSGGSGTTWTAVNTVA